MTEKPRKKSANDAAGEAHEVQSEPTAQAAPAAPTRARRKPAATPDDGQWVEVEPTDAPPATRKPRARRAMPVEVERLPEQPDSALSAPPPAPSMLPPMEEVVAELAAMTVRELVKRHVEMLGKAPRIKNRVWLQRKLAWFEQTKRFGGLSNAAKKRLDELMGEIQLPVPTPRGARTSSGKLPTPRSADDLPLGTRLERRWRDQLITATRVEGGWECEGATYRTLSAAAKAVSGSHVSGPAFFGLRSRKDAR